MIKLLKAEEVAEVLRVSKQTAYGYMRQMAHLDQPLRVTETALAAWINDRMRGPAEAAMPKVKPILPKAGTAKRGPDGLFHVPRRRPQCDEG